MSWGEVMVSTVKSRPNHYEVLGLLPTASREEIAAAFARAMSMFGARPIALAAHIGVAFEVLRDPAKRRAYDRSLGLAPQDAPGHWSFVRHSWGPMIASASMSAPVAAEPHVTAEAQAEPPAEPKPDLFAAPALRDARPPRPTAEKQEPGLDAVLADILRVGREEKQRLRDAGPVHFNWTRPVLVVSGLLVAAGVIGAVAGLSVTHNEESAHAEPAVTVGLPEPHEAAEVASATAVPLAGSDGQPAERPRHTRFYTPSRAAVQQPTAPSPGVQLAATDIAQASGDNGQFAEDPLAPQPAPAQPVAASMPLSNAVIARTIERIGYPCGEVASTEASGAGMFKVTCSSGQTYQATPVHGRYRFRRAGSR